MVHIKTPLIFLRATSDPRWPYFLSARHFPCLRAGNSLLLGSGQVFPPITLNLQNCRETIQKYLYSALPLPDLCNVIYSWRHNLWDPRFHQCLSPGCINFKNLSAHHQEEVLRIPKHPQLGKFRLFRAKLWHFQKSNVLRKLKIYLYFEINGHIILFLGNFYFL